MLSVILPNRIRLAVVTETWPPEVNGVAHTIAHLVRGLRELNEYQIQLVRPRQLTDGEPTTDADFEEYLVSGLSLPFYKEVRVGAPQFFALRQQWKKQRPDIVQIVTEGPLGYSALRAAKSLGIPVFSDFHTNFDQYSQHYHLKYGFELAGRYLRHVHNQTLRTLVPTTELINQLADNGYKNLGILERGIDAKLFNPERRNAVLRAQYGIAEDQLLVVLVTRMAQEKNLDLAFEAFRAIQQTQPDAQFLLVGDGPERARLAALHTDCIFAGMQTGTALAEHYASGDLFLYASTSETFGNVIIEAMASGLPVVTYDYAAAHKYIDSGHNGYTAPFNDSQAFIQGAVALADQPKLRRQIGIQARQTAQQLSWESVVLRLDTIIKSLLSEVNHETSASA